jgi:hypothetical protein
MSAQKLVRQIKLNNLQFTHEIAFPSAGVRIVTLAIEGNGEKFAQDLRLDVLEHAWVG